MDPLWALDDLLGDHSNFIGLFQTLTYVKLKKSIDYLRWVPKLLRGRYQTGLTWKDQNMGRKVEVIYMDAPCNAC